MHGQKILKIPEYELKKCNPCTAKSWFMFVRKFTRICVQYGYQCIVSPHVLGFVLFNVAGKVHELDITHKFDMVI